MELLRKILGAANMLIFVWFALPSCLSSSLNIGNMTGMAIAALIFLYAVLTPRIHAVVSVWKKHRIKKWLYRAAILVLVAIIALAVVETICMIRAAGKKPDEEDTVVVLGCRVYGERASLSLEERLRAAYSYLQEHETAKCVLSGGRGSGEDISEAECMYRYLVDKGIDPSRLYKEGKSTTTRENLYYSKQIIEENGLNPAIAIATSEYHEYRAGKIAKSLGMDCAAVPARTAIWLFPTYYVRELYAILYEWVF